MERANRDGGWWRVAALLLALLTGGGAGAGVRAGEKTPAGVEYLVPADLDTVFTRAEKEKKSVFLFVTTPACGWCKHMETRIFTDPMVAFLMGKSCLLVKADISTPEGKKLAEDYPGEGTPRLYLMNGKAEIIDSTPGAFPEPGACLAWLLMSLKPAATVVGKLEKMLPASTFTADATVAQMQTAAAVLYACGKKDKAKKVYGPAAVKRMKTDQEKNSFAWFWAHDVKDNLPAALAAAQEAVALKRDAGNLDTLGYCQFMLKDYATAIATAEEVMKLAPKREEFQARLDSYREAVKEKAKK